MELGWEVSGFMAYIAPGGPVQSNAERCCQRTDRVLQPVKEAHMYEAVQALQCQLQQRLSCGLGVRQAAPKFSRRRPLRVAGQSQNLDVNQLPLP